MGNIIEPGCPDVAYCNHCKHQKRDGWGPSLCKINFTIEHDHLQCWKEYVPCNIQNKNNGCKQFELRWWRDGLKYSKKKMKTLFKN